jgi:hypothetical protein
MLGVGPGRAASAEGNGGMPELIAWGTQVGETLELVFVFLTVMGSLAIMVLLGAWWQR